MGNVAAPGHGSNQDNDFMRIGPCSFPQAATPAAATQMPLRTKDVWAVCLCVEDEDPEDIIGACAILDHSRGADGSIPLCTSLGDYRGRDFPGQCELAWRTLLAAIVEPDPSGVSLPARMRGRYRLGKVLLPTKRMLSVLEPLLRDRLGIKRFGVWKPSLEGVFSTFSPETHVVEATDGDDETLDTSEVTEARVKKRARRLLKAFRGTTEVPPSWYVVPSGFMPRDTLCWGWRSNLEFAVKRGDPDVVRIIARAVPVSSKLLDHLARVRIFAEARLLLRRAAERCFESTVVAVLDYCYATLDGTGFGQTSSAWLRAQQVAAGGNGVTPLCTCCYPVESHRDSTEAQIQLEGVTDEALERIALLLLRRGADPMIKSSPVNKGIHALFMATINAKLSILREMMLDPRSDPDGEIGDGMTARRFAQIQVEEEGPGWKCYEQCLAILSAPRSSGGGGEAAAAADAAADGGGRKRGGCDYCGSGEAQLRCSRCKAKWYCNKSCQKASVRKKLSICTDTDYRLLINARG